METFEVVSVDQMKIYLFCLFCIKQKRYNSLLLTFAAATVLYAVVTCLAQLEPKVCGRGAEWDRTQPLRAVGTSLTTGNAALMRTTTSQRHQVVTGGEEAAKNCLWR